MNIAPRRAPPKTIQRFLNGPRRRSAYFHALAKFEVYSDESALVPDDVKSVKTRGLPRLLDVFDSEDISFAAAPL